MNKTDLIKRIIHERGELETVIHQLNPAQMETPTVPDGWTVKEVMGHITFWEQNLLADFAGLARGEPVRELNSSDEINALNDGMRKKNAVMMLSQVKEEFELSGRQLLDWLHALPEAELDRPFAYGMNLGEFVEEDTWKHYREHRDMVSGLFGLH